MGKTLANQIADWQAAVDHAPTTAYSARLICRRIETELGATELAQLSARDLDLWYRQLAAGGMTPNTIRHHHAIIRAVLAYAVDWQDIPTNVALSAHPPKAVTIDETDRVPTIEHLTTIMNGTRGPLRLAVMLAATTGMRRGELVALQWADLRNGALWVGRSAYKVPGGELGYKTPKNRKPKVIPLNTSMLDELSRHWKPDATWIVAKPDGTGYPPDWLSKEWSRACARHGWRYKFHGLRHLHGSVLVDSGISLTAAAARQGHSVQTMTAHYLHPVNASAQAAANVIETVFAPLFTPKRERPAAVSPKRD